MKSTNPDDLERLAAITPSGAMKRQIEDAIFENLLATDPEAALKRAKATDAPLVAAVQLAKIGASLLTSDPEKAFGIGADILAACPEKLAPEKRIDIGSNNMSWGAEPNTATKFMESLLIKDPSRTLEMTTAGSDTVSATFRDLSRKWAERDLPAYTDWVNHQSDPGIRNAAASQIVSQLSSQGHFQEAAEWAMSGQKPDPGNLYNLAIQWSRSNREDASAWVESVNVSEDVKSNLRSFLKHNE
ncbi:MAG: hypothetical protein H7Y36_07175 [Armatimonadetes bacterium]|nr:hypothetical protein [Akkermansiaceae bacterium]